MSPIQPGKRSTGRPGGGMGAPPPREPFHGGSGAPHHDNPPHGGLGSPMHHGPSGHPPPGAPSHFAPHPGIGLPPLPYRPIGPPRFHYAGHGPYYGFIRPGWRGPRILRRTARRFMYGQYIVIGLIGSYAVFYLLPWQLTRIEQYYGMQAEFLTEAQMYAALEALHIEQTEIEAEAYARMLMMDAQEVGMDPNIAQGLCCPNCRSAITPDQNFCTICGYKLVE